MTGRTLAIGDIHGCYRALVALLDALSISGDDTVVFLGDAVDRGPSSKQVVDRILELRQICKVIFIMGNHEEMMRNAISGRGLFGAWLDAGGQATLDSYGGSIENIPPQHIRFLLSASAYWESDKDIFIHASLESGNARGAMPGDTHSGDVRGQLLSRLWQTVAINVLEPYAVGVKSPSPGSAVASTRASAPSWVVVKLRQVTPKGLNRISVNPIHTVHPTRYRIWSSTAETHLGTSRRDDALPGS